MNKAMLDMLRTFAEASISHRLLKTVEEVVLGGGAADFVMQDCEVNLKSDGRRLRLTCTHCGPIKSKVGTIDEMLLQIVPFIQAHIHRTES